MKLKVKLSLLLGILAMLMVGIGSGGCSNDEYVEEEIYEVSSTKYIFRYESRVTILQEIYLKNKVPDYLYDGDYYSKRYLTDSGDTLRIRPKIALAIKNEDEIYQVVKQFGDKLLFDKKIGYCFVYNCNVRNSDEVLEITTILSLDEERVTACDAFTDARMESF